MATLSGVLVVQSFKTINPAASRNRARVDALTLESSGGIFTEYPLRIVVHRFELVCPEDAELAPPVFQRCRDRY
jgi:hypothetical protein